MSEHKEVPIETIKFPRDTCMNILALKDRKCKNCQYDCYADCEDVKKRHLKQK